MITRQEDSETTKIKKIMITKQRKQEYRVLKVSALNSGIY